MFRKSAILASAMMVVAAPAMASAAPINPAASLSLAPTVRAGHTAKHHSDLFGASALIVVAVLVVVGVGAAAGAGAFSSSN